MDNNFEPDILQICRTCMKEITDESFIYLDLTPSANTQLTIRQTLYSCIPELDLSIVSNAVICGKCVDNLLSVYEFKKNCLELEIQINKYIQQVQHTSDVNLVEVVRFQQSHIKNLGVEVKMEDLEITEDFKNEDLVCDTSAFNEASECRESTEPQYLLELQKVELEDVLFNTFDDCNINYNLSVAEENSDAHNSNIAQNYLREALEHQDNYSKNLNKTNAAYYQCYKCGHKADSKLKLVWHLKRHKTLKNFYHSEIISKRLSRYKNLFSYYSCPLCNYITKYKCLCDFHTRIHSTKKDYKHIFEHTDVQTKALPTTIKINKTNVKGNKRKCVKNCNNYDDKRRFKNRNKSKESQQHLSHSRLKPNKRADTVDKLFKCSICEYQCNCKVNLKQHMGLHIEEKPFSCSVCGYQCSLKSRLKQHVQIHTGEKPFSCSICEYQCNQKGVLNRHIRIHTGEKPFTCSVCDYQCSRKTHLKRHMQIHTGEKPFLCVICKYQCSDKSQLNGHIRIHIGETFVCAICKYQCSEKSNLKQHMLIHTREKPFICSVCQNRFRSKRHLKQHVLIHTGEKPFSCSVCEYQCSWKSSLNRHMKIHTGEKPFLCSVCKYQCSGKSTLKQHMLIHTGEKPFMCSVCEYQCSRKTHLKQHLLIHTGEKSFSCSACKYQCSLKQNLKRHMRIHVDNQILHNKLKGRRVKDN